MKGPIPKGGSPGRAFLPVHPLKRSEQILYVVPGLRPGLLVQGEVIEVAQSESPLPAYLVQPAGEDEKGREWIRADQVRYVLQMGAQEQEQ